MTRIEMVLKTLVDLPFNHLTWLLAQEHFVRFSRLVTFKLCIIFKRFFENCNALEVMA